jgi:hypothetical protein
MVPDFAFEIKPVAVGKQDAKRDDLTRQDFANGVEITTTFGKIGDTSGVAFIIALPNRVEMHTQPGFRSSFIHGPEAIINFLRRRAKKNLEWKYLGTTDAEGFGDDLKGSGQSSRKFSIDFQIDLRLALSGPDGHFPC